MVNPIMGLIVLDMSPGASTCGLNIVYRKTANASNATTQTPNLIEN